jgi:hypothetical protein
MQTSKYTFSFDVMHFVFEWALILNHWGGVGVVIMPETKETSEGCEKAEGGRIASWNLNKVLVFWDGGTL